MFRPFQLYAEFKTRIGNKMLAWVIVRYTAWLSRRLVLRRARELQAGRPPGSTPLAADRWKAAAIDFGVPFALAAVMCGIAGFETYRETTVSFQYGTTTRDFTEWNPSLTAVLFWGAVIYAAGGWLGSKSDTGQTLGQEIFDYSIRSVDTGAPVTGKDFFKRHLLRLPAAVLAVADRFTEGTSGFKHDAWAKTKAISLGDAAAPSPTPTPSADSRLPSGDAAPRQPVPAAPAPAPAPVPAPEHAPADQSPAPASSSPTPTTTAAPTSSSAPGGVTCGACGQRFASEVAARRHAMKAHLTDGADGEVEPVKLIT